MSEMGRIAERLLFQAARVFGFVLIISLSWAVTSEGAEKIIVTDDISAPEIVSPTTNNPGDSDYAIQLEQFSIDPSRGGFAPKSGVESIEEFVSGETGYYIVQFDGPVQKAWKTPLVDAGVEFFDYIPKFSFIIRMDSKLESLVSTQEHVRWLGIYQPSQRISQQAHEKFLTGDTKSAVLEELRVIVFPGEDLDRITKAVRDAGGEIQESVSTKWKTTLRVLIPSENIAALSAISGVKWIEPQPQWRLNNNKATDVIDGRTARDTHRLYGEGQTVGVCDSGLDKGSIDPANLHDDFEDGSGASRVAVIFDRVGDGGSDVNSGHGTHVAGSVLGNGDLSGATPSADTFPSGSFAGTAPKARLVFQAIEDDSEEQIAGIPADLNALFGQAHGAGADLHTNSWGNALTRSMYTTQSQDLDEYMWDHKDFLILFAAGNKGIDKNSDGVIDLYSLETPGTAKNCLTVGASENNRPSGEGITVNWGTISPFSFPEFPIAFDLPSDDVNGMAAFSSRGPTIDGRYKPDIVAPGTNILSTRSSVASGTGWGVYNAYYMYMGGASMATPITAGAVALVREYLIKEMKISTPSAALVKAAMLNGATDINPGQYGEGAGREIPAGPVPNNVEGWGRVDVSRSTYPGSDFHILYWDETNSLDTGEHKDFQIVVNGAGSPLKANLVWTDYPGTPSANGGLVNDLDLLVTDPSSSARYPDNALQHSSVSTKHYNSGTSIALSGTSKRAIRFTPDTYPAYVASTTFFNINEINIVQSVNVVVYSDNGGIPGSELMRKTLTRVPTGYTTVELGLTITAGDFWIAVEKSGSGTHLLVDQDGNPTGRSFYWNNISWVASSFTAFIGANFRGTLHSTSYDRVNNVIGLTLNNPQTGTYTIRVSGYNVPQGPQAYALVVSGDISEPPVEPPESYSHTWLGMSTLWTSEDNWDSGTLPGNDATVLIPSAPADGNNFPAIASGVNAVAKKLTATGGPVSIQAAGTLTIGN